MRRRREEEPLSWDEANAIIRAIMRMGEAMDELKAMLVEIRGLLEDEDGEEEEEADA